MTGTKHILDGLTPAQQQAEIDRARLVMKEITEQVLDELAERFDGLYALAYAVTKELTPEDPKNPPDDHPVIAWKLAQVLEGLLGHTHEMQTARTFLLGEK